MGQIDSFKRVLGIAGQNNPLPDTGIEVKEEIMVTPPKVVRQKKETKQRTLPKCSATVAVSKEMHQELTILKFWAFQNGVISEQATQAILRLALDCFYKKYPEAKIFVEQY